MQTRAQAKSSPKKLQQHPGMFGELLTAELQKYHQFDHFATEMQSTGRLDILFNVLHEVCRKEYTRLFADTMRNNTVP